MRRVASSVPRGLLLPFLVAAGLLLPGCPLTDGYYLMNDDPSGVGFERGDSSRGRAGYFALGTRRRL